MDPYLALFLTGCVGLSLMTALGAAGNHGHHAGGHAAHGAEGFHLHGTGGHGTHLHSDTHFHHAPIGHLGHADGSGAHSHGHSAAGHGHAASSFNLRVAVLGWLSPRVLLTLSMGSGATGICLAPILQGEPLRAIVALSGGIALEKLVVAPLWSVLTRFASSPARTLDSAVLEEATALTAFDADGCGLVSVTLDGHEMRLLGRLEAEHRSWRVRSGETLLVESVDGTRGQCIVSPLKSPPVETSPP